MKKIYILVSLIMLALAWSCGEDDNLQPVGNWNLSAPELLAPSENMSIVLDDAAPDDTTTFEWQTAVANNRFGVAHTFMLLPEESTTYDKPILSVTFPKSQETLSVQITSAEIDYALWAACYPAGAVVKLKWVVVAKSIEKTTEDSQKITIKRFETEYKPTTLFITGDGTEAGADVTNATKMRARKDADGKITGIFDVYTTLTEGKTYHFRDKTKLTSKVFGGGDGNLSCGGSSIVAAKTAVHRITVDLNTNTYQLWEVEKWSLVGDAVEGGWGGDVPLAYKGLGVWESEIEFYLPYETAGFIFRANEDWGYIIKRIKGEAAANNRSGKVLMESEAGDAGKEVEDLPGVLGPHIVKLDLSGDGYTYTLTPKVVQEPGVAVIGKSNNLSADAVTGYFDFGDYEIPEELYLLSEGTMVAQLTKDGNVFRSEKYIALEASKTYELNSASDGSGTTYNEHGDGTIAVDHDQAYQINVDFDADRLLWKHYNIKLFHWDEVGGGWDARQELLMTYVHPYTYEVTGELTAGYHSKFNSPWEVQFGTNSTALSGTMTNGGDNFAGIASSGTYDATIIVSDDYTTAEYTFVKQ